MKTAVHDVWFLYTPGIYLSSALQGAKCIHTDDTKNIGTKSFLGIEEIWETFWGGNHITKLEDGGTLEFNGAYIYILITEGS